MVNYSNGDYYPYDLVNAYVGGDAYNYIINGNYATGYFVLTAVLVLAAVGCVALHYLWRATKQQESMLLAIKNISVANPVDNQK